MAAQTVTLERTALTPVDVTSLAEASEKYQNGISVQDALVTLGVTDANPTHLQIIDAYNKTMIELSPLNRSLYSGKDSTNNDDLTTAKKFVSQAYRGLANILQTKGVKQNGALYLPKYFIPQAPAKDLTARLKNSNVLESETGLVIKPSEGISVYDAYMNWFNSIQERIEKEQSNPTPTEKRVLPAKKVILNDFYYDPTFTEMQKKLMERGFKKQFPKDLKALILDKVTFNGGEVHSFFYWFDGNHHDIEYDYSLTNETFNQVFFSSSTGYYVDDSFSAPTESLLAEDIWDKESLKKEYLWLKPGILFATMWKDENKYPRPAYLIGQRVDEEVDVPLKNSELNHSIYKKILGYQSPTKKELLNFLKRIHNLEGKYQLKNISKESLEYPLSQDVLEAYCAAEDSNLFRQSGNKLEFLQPTTPVDPILNGKILGGQNLPIAWWV